MRHARRWAWLSALVAAALLWSLQGEFSVLGWAAQVGLGGDAPDAQEPAPAAQSTARPGSEDASPPNMASFIAAEALQDSAEKPGSAAAESPATPGNNTPRLSPQAARAVTERVLSEWACDLVYSATTPKALEKREREWRWLPVEMASAERQGLRDAAARIGRGCPAARASKAERDQRRARQSQDLAAARQAGDLQALLSEPPGGLDATPQQIDQARAALYDAVLSGDPEVIRRMYLIDSWLTFQQRPSMRDGMLDRRQLWILLACDFGLDCLPGGPALDRACLTSSAYCASPSFEAAVRTESPEWSQRLLDQRRNEILQRIRSGQIAGLFDPPPPPPDGGP